ncbi:PAS domain-containing protein [Limnoraphis robusta Tam1]|uniref:PAS domain-containing protein n=1 Tax=Limnoraphis robusta TaxID=1118279 RepID=UPI002B20ACE7|nr:PAS domain-containing protein [Limnoraphis robusta]MEA5541955.1 PAS domain-containing protein [Limnoraphis robusta Tam1]
MLLNTLSVYSPRFDEIVDPVSFSVTPSQSVQEAVILMSQVTNPNHSGDRRTRSQYTVVVEADHCVGILGEHQIVEAIATGKNLADLRVAEVMITPSPSLNEDDQYDISTILSLFQNHQIDLLPVLNAQGKIRGMITANRILQVLKPINTSNTTPVVKQSVEHPKTLDNSPLSKRPDKHLENEELKHQLIQYITQLHTAQQRIQQETNQRQLIQRIDQKLRSSQQEIRAFLAALTDLVLIVHFTNGSIEVKDTPPSQFCPINPEIIKETIRQFSRSTQIEYFTAPIQQALRTQQVVSFEYRLNTDQGIFWFSAKISPLSEDTVVWVAQDITPHKQTEQALQKLTAALEHRVIERTAELQKVNTNLRQVLRERELTEQQLRDSEQKFRQLAESIREVFLIWSVDTFELLYISPAFEQIWGMSPASLYENPRLWFEMIHPQDQQRIQDNFLESFKEGNFNQEYRIIRSDGEVRWIWTRSFPVRNELGVVYRIVSLAEDITERRRVEEALAESEGRLATLADISPVGIFRTDIAGHYLYVNERTSEIIGQGFREFIGQYWTTMVHPSNLQYVEQSWLMTRNHYQPLELEYKLHRADGIITWVFAQVIPEFDDGGVVKGFVGTLTDISERKQVEMELQQLNQQLETIVEQRTAQLQETNEKLRHEINQRQQVQNQIAAKAYQQAIIADLGQKALSGIDYDQLIEQTVIRVARCLNVESAQVLDVPIQNPDLLKLLTATLQQNHQQDDSLASASKQAKDQEIDLIEQQIAFPSIDSHSNLYGISIAIESCSSCFGILSAYTSKQRVFSRDDVYFLQSVAHILATAIERNQTESQLKTSLKEKEVLLKEIHHRVKNNLLVVSNILEFQTDYTDNLEVIKILQDSQKRIESMALIHEKLYQSTGLDQIDFGDYIQDLVSQLMESYDPNRDLIELELDVESIGLNLETAHPCGLILNELVSNAFKHAFPHNRSGKIWVKLHQNSDNVVALTVRDNGIGFPQNIDFRQVDSLGMELVCTLIDQLDGHIELIRDNGTTFYLTFKELQYRQRY